MPDFQLRSEYRLQGDQGQAVEQIVRCVQRGDRFQTRLAASRTGIV